MKYFLFYFRRIDWILTISVLLLATLGLLMIYSIGSGRGSFVFFKRQVFFLVGGLALMFLMSLVDWRIFRDSPYLILGLYFISLLALLGLFFFVSPIRGTVGWYKIGSFSFDPIEPVKIILIILLAKYFSTRHIEMYSKKHILLSGFYVLAPAALIFLQPDLGSVLVLLAFWLGILIVSGIRLKHLLVLFFCGILIFIFGWLFLLKDYQKERIISFIAPQIDPLGIGWSQTQSKIAIGSGGFWGQGLFKGSQTQYGFLPEAHTDFIFASISEELGFVGVVFLFLLFFLLFSRIIKIAIEANSNFPRLFAIGFGIMIFVQFFIHIGMNLGILPVVGISLPFISYGGSALIFLFIGIGILQSIKLH